MMFFSLRAGVSLLAVLGVGTFAYRLDEPHDTPINRRYDANGWTPLSTWKSEPVLDVFKRRGDPALCGYSSGQDDYPTTCDTSSSRVRNTSLSRSSSCPGTSKSDCNVYTSRVANKSASACLSPSDCANNKYALACTSPISPFCATIYKTVSGARYDRYACAVAPISYEILSTTEGCGSGSCSSRVNYSARNSSISYMRSGNASLGNSSSTPSCADLSGIISSVTTITQAGGFSRGYEDSGGSDGDG
ncbi:hypothetical protein P280DRAFT_507795 [Massarina eburnea CBS 473.64]|uniref:Uncharacterized protein n=1 Tax=Massarina eburnea CBS 473.64 TaxID=1395130 RepID=A0A6A6RXH4_9PLEO|nr:hypothetical protein P280DRAFT_507795 [Massarina eburnea CBS 473.64]